jgi:hypothetical protein
MSHPRLGRSVAERPYSSGPAQEPIGVAFGGCREAGIRPVEAEEVQVVERMVEEVGQGLGVARLIVHAGEQGVLEEELAARPLHVVAGGVHQLGDGVV